MGVVLITLLKQGHTVDSSNNYPQVKRIKQSRWIAKSAVSRYDEHARTYINENFREDAGWYKGARVGKTKAKDKAMRIF